MSGTGPEQSGTPAGGSGSGSGGGWKHWWFVAVPAATFVVGLLLGWLVTSAGSEDGGEPAATETVSVSPSPTESADTTVVVPRECVEAAEKAQEATQLIVDNFSSLKDFQGDQIISSLDQLEQLSRETRELSQSCRDVDVSSTPSASPTS